MKQKPMFIWNSLAFSTIHLILAIWSLVPLPFLNPVWTSEISRFTYCWSLVSVSSVGKESICNAGDPGLIPESGRSAGEGIDYLLQYSWASLVAQLVKIHLQCGRPGSDPWAGKIPWRREKLPTSVFWYGEFHGVEESRTSLSNFHFHFDCPKVFRWHPVCLDVARP